MKKNLSFLIWGFVSTELFATTVNPPSPAPIQEAPALDYTPIRIPSSWQPISSMQSKEETQPVKISIDELKNSPQLLQTVMKAAVQQEQLALLRKILPIYEQSTQPNPIILNYAKGLVAKSEQQYALATHYFTEVEHRVPNSEKAILHHIDSLLSDQNIWLAEQLTQSYLKAGYSPKFQHQLQQFHLYIQQRQAWRNYILLEFINDKNINNAPDKTQVGGFTFEEKRADTGLAYQFGTAKTFFMSKGFYSQLQTDFIGKNYRTYHQYNDFYGRIATILGYATYRHQWRLEPYAALRIFAGKPYTNHLGLATSWQYQWAKNFRSKITFNYATERYRQNQYKHLNNYTQNLLLNHTWFINSQWHSGINLEIGKKYASKYRQDRYVKYGAGLTLGYQNENLGINIRLVREHKYFRAPFYWGLSNGEKRQDRETQLYASIWSPRVQFFGITPALTYKYQRVNSNSVNIPYHKQSLTVEIQKFF